jgi:hypothetical protein
MSLMRRELLLLAAALPAAARLGATRASQPAARRLFVYDPRLPAAVWRPLAAQHGLIEALLLEGDRVRFARACLATAPDWIGGLIRPADLLVLAGSAEEEGLRLLKERRLRRAGGPDHVFFSMQRRGGGAAA